MKRAALTLSVLLALPGCAPPPPAPPGPTPAAPRVVAHYMPWFRAEPTPGGGIQWEHWQWFGKGTKHDPDDVDEKGRRDIASIYYPLIGPYHGADPDVIEYHMRTAKAAGIDGFVADWYGPGTYTDGVFSQMVRVAERENFSVAVCLEEKSFFPGYTTATSRAEVVAVMAGHIRHVLDQHATSRAYLRRNGRPVFLIFNNHEDGVLGRHVLTPAEVAQALSSVGAPILLVRGHTNSNYYDVARGAYAWVGDAAYRTNFYETAKGAGLDLVVGVANPGFDDTGVWGWGNGPRVTDRRGGEEYAAQWRDALAHPPDLVQIVTWNDFGEGTTIEPAAPYGFQYLNLTEDFVGQLTGRPVNHADNEIPLAEFQKKKGILP